MLKKIITLASLSILGAIGFLSNSSVEYDDPLLYSKELNTYIVQVKGNVQKDSKKSLAKSRNEVISQVKFSLNPDSYNIKNIYDTVYNGFSIEITDQDASRIKKMPNVISIEKSKKYALPEAAESDVGYPTRAERLKNFSAISMNATDDSIERALIKAGAATADEKKSQAGKNTTIAICDTGLYYNQVAGTETRIALEKAKTDATTNKIELNAPAFKDLNEGEFKYDKDTVDALLTPTGGTLSNDYYSRINNKIFFARDYADGDNDVDPKSKSQEHGTHVASIAAANGDDMVGIAPKAQVAVMKIFSDRSAGASDAAIIAAINDCAKLKIDVVNLSIGRDLETGSDSIKDATYEAIKNCNAIGTIVNFSAGNAGKSSFQGSKSYSDWAVDTVETGILGSSAHYDESCNIIASSNNTQAFYESFLTVQKNGETQTHFASYRDEVVYSETQKQITTKKLESLIPTGATTHTLDFVHIPGIGKASDYKDENGNDLDVSGKVAVIDRGVLSFTKKYQNAYAKGAVAVVVINNDSSTSLNFSMDFADTNPAIPVVMVLKNTSDIWGPALTKGQMTLGKNSTQNSTDGNMLSTFSSDGGDYNLDIGISLTAPGYQILGAVSADTYTPEDTTTQLATTKLTGYEAFNGTSMSAPNVTGALALYLSEKNPVNNSKLAFKDLTAGGTTTTANDRYVRDKKVLSMKAQSTADKVVDATGKADASVRVQGSGIPNVSSMLQANSYISSLDPDSTWGEDRYQSRAELRNNDDLKSNLTDDKENYISFTYKVTNDSDSSRTYKPSLSLMIPQLRVQTPYETYAAEKENESTSLNEVIGYDKETDKQFNVNNKETYPSGCGKLTQSIYDDHIEIPTDHQPSSSITVNAHETITETIRVRIDDLQITKDFGTTKFSDLQNGVYTGTLKQYLNTYFKESGGSIVEGFLTLDDQDSTLDDQGKKDMQLTMPYLGFYGDYTVAKAVEDFPFEKTKERLYTSDLVDNYLKYGLNDKYKKDTQTGSSICGTKGVVTKDKIQGMNKLNWDGMPNGNDKQYITGDKNDGIYVGAKNTSNIFASFFVNRSIAKGTWTITQDGSQQNIATGKIDNTIETMDSNDIVKSFLITDSSDSGGAYTINRAYCNIDVSNIPEGEYKLTFSFDLKGVQTGKDDKDNILYHTQNKEYPLFVDKTAPEFVSSELTEEDGSHYLKVTAKGCQKAIGIGDNTVDVTKLDNDLYEAKSYVNERYIEENRMLITLEDFAHNYQNVILHPKDNTYVLTSTEFTYLNDFSIVLYHQDNDWNYYKINLKEDGAAYTPEENYKLLLNIGKDVDASKIKLKIDGEESTNIEYDSSTGYVTLLLPPTTSTFTMTNLDSAKVDPSTNKPNKGNVGLVLGITIPLCALAVGAGVAIPLLIINKKKKGK